MKSFFKFLVFTLTAVAVNCMYDSSDEVVELTDSNFDSRVTHSDSIWVVEFYAPWCGHCKSLAPEYKKAAKALKGTVKVGAVNCDDNKSSCGQYGIRGFPTIKIFGSKKTPVDYNGARNALGIIDSALAEAKTKAKDILSGGGSSSSSSGSKSSGKNEVVELTDANFDKLVLESDDVWLVEFFAPWCGHCKNLAPHWEKAAAELKGKVKLGALDATVHTTKASQYGIQGYPTIKFFPGGKKDRHSVQDYDGGRTSSDIVTWALDKYADSVPAPEIKELVGQTTYKECIEKPLCIFSFLPHILDCDSTCRNTYIKILQDLGDKYKQKLWGWVWMEAGAQTELESSLDIGGFGYPAMAVLNHKKAMYSVLKGSFTYEGISAYLRDISFGRGQTSQMKSTVPKIEEISGWDGKDGVLPEEEDIDLSDVELDDIKDEL
ncbi:protein disulfide-isomerase A6 homolog [Culicoides brevitarsis]|uniref:protein disulfide-isomerase A6 homolog n=1 Tax=Culicoides brevitarsis TaxID=469753 RepID=UPI00307C89AB